MPGRTINNRPQVNKTTNVTYIAGNSVQRSRADPLVRAGPPGPALRPANSAPHVIPERPTEADRREAADQGSACQRSIVRQASDIGLTT